MLNLQPVVIRSAPKICSREHTVDGRNPAPPGMVKTLYININNGIMIILGGAGFCPSTVSPSFAHLIKSLSRIASL